MGYLIGLIRLTMDIAAQERPAQDPKFRDSLEYNGTYVPYGLDHGE